MGNHLDTYTNLSVIKHMYDWIQISQHSNYNVAIDILTLLEAQQYEVCSQNYEKDLKIYELRNLSPFNFIKTYQVILMNPPSFCGSSMNMKVYIQRISFRLRDIGRIKFEQGLYILETILIALKQLSFYYSLVAIDEDMIGFNNLGQCKIWINQDFSNNNPSKFINNLTQSNTVNHLMLLVQQRMQKQPLYLQKKQKENIIKFQQAIKFIQKQRNSYGIKVYSIWIPNSLQNCEGKSVLENIKSQQNDNFIDITMEQSQKQFTQFMKLSSFANKNKKQSQLKQKQKKSNTFIENNNKQKVFRNKTKSTSKLSNISVRYFRTKQLQQKLISPIKKSLKVFIDKQKIRSRQSVWKNWQFDTNVNEKYDHHIQQKIYDHNFCNKESPQNAYRNK